MGRQPLNVTDSKPPVASSKWVIRDRIKLGSKGFTAAELIMYVTIAAILAGSAAPFLLGNIERSRLDTATRRLMAEVRLVQSLAVTRSGVYGFHWGGDPDLGGLSNSQYRIEQDAGTCDWPAATDTTGSNPNVITDWFNLAREYPGITIQSVMDSNGALLGGVTFNAIAASVNTCTAVTFPVTITIANTTGVTRTIQVQSAGSVRIL